MLAPRVRRWITRLSFALAPALVFVPYPTQLSPALHLRVLDPQGGGIPSDEMMWRGGFYADYFEESVSTDGQGGLDLPSRIVWLSPASRLLAAFGSVLPEGGGFRHAFAEAYFELPPGFELDPACVGPVPEFDNGLEPPYSHVRTWNLPGSQWHVSFNEGGGEHGLVSIATDHPATAGVSTHRLVLRLKPVPVTQPVTRPDSPRPSPRQSPDPG
jgi:hypothetical protein